MSTLSEGIQSSAQAAVKLSKSPGHGVLDYSLASFDVAEEMLAEASGYAARMSSVQIDGQRPPWAHISWDAPGSSSVGNIAGTRTLTSPCWSWASLLFTWRWPPGEKCAAG